jgi:hypothetical protein
MDVFITRGVKFRRGVRFRGLLRGVRFRRAVRGVRFKGVIRGVRFRRVLRGVRFKRVLRGVRFRRVIRRVLRGVIFRWSDLLLDVFIIILIQASEYFSCLL